MNASVELARELGQCQRSAVEFKRLLEAARDSRGPLGLCLHPYAASEYRRMRLFLACGGLAGFALRGTELVSMFAHRSAAGRGLGPLLANQAAREGADRLDAYATVLPCLYAQAGFRPVASMQWNDEFAPAGWDYDALIRFNCGRPDVVFMARTPRETAVRRVATYAAGRAAQALALAPGGSR